MSYSSKIVFSPRYDLLPNGFGLLHPFDMRKYSRAWNELEKRNSARLIDRWIQPKAPIDDDSLLRVHTPQYVESLLTPAVIAHIIEVHIIKYLPISIINKYILEPMKYACEGTRLATEHALADKTMVMNMGGGYHHAFSDHGEGFCVFADAAVAIADARKRDALAEYDKVLMIDLDAHRGNGFNAIAAKDDSIDMFDMYNFQTYPGLHEGDVDETPFMIPIKRQTTGDAYLAILKEELPKFMDAAGEPKLVFYNAGTDILSGDRLGHLKVGFDEVIARDRYVIDLLKSKSIPTVIMTSGGYTKESYKLVATQAAMVIE